MTHMEDINPKQSFDLGNSGKTLIEPVAFEPIPEAAARQRWRASPLMKVGAAAIATALLLLGYLFSAKSLYIEISPDHNQLEQLQLDVSGLLTIKTGDRFLLLSGQHEIHASALGYFDYRETLTIGGSDSQRQSITLEPLPGHLTVTTSLLHQGQTSLAQAAISIDGQALGFSGKEIRDLSAGQHQLSINTPHYQTLQQTIDITGRDQSQSLDLVLKPNWADVSLTSAPSGADVFDGETLLGKTPLQTKLLAGKHQLLVKLGGHKSWQQSLRVYAEQQLSLPIITLQAADARVNVTSNPSGASITVNGLYQGQTPLEVALAPGKDYRFTLFKDGFDAQHRSLSIGDQEQRTLRVNLQAELGDIQIQATPSDALLYVDGRLMGRANQQITLTAKQHDIIIRKEGYADHTTRVLPRPDLSQTLKITLLTTEQDLWRKVPLKITNTTGQQLLLFRPNARFTMGASRRQQGRRANEVQRQITLERGFYMSDTPVSNNQYRQFDRFHSSGHVKGNSLNGENYPVVNITWEKAAAYCNWLSEQEGLNNFYTQTKGVISGIDPLANGYRLPSEAEWAWAARYNNGKMKTYTWGRRLPPAPKSGNYGDRSAAELLGNILTNYDDGFKVTAPLKRFPANAKNLYGFGGNTAEWVHDFYGIKTGLSLKTETDPLGPEKGDYHVIRGSSWAHATMTDLRLAFRDYSNQGRNDVGFRVVRYVK